MAIGRNWRYERWRWQTFAVTWLAYFGFYLTRKSFSVAKIGIDQDPTTDVSLSQRNRPEDVGLPPIEQYHQQKQATRHEGDAPQLEPEGSWKTVFAVIGNPTVLALGASGGAGTACSCSWPAWCSWPD